MVAVLSWASGHVPQSEEERVEVGCDLAEERPGTLGRQRGGLHQTPVAEPEPQTEQNGLGREARVGFSALDLVLIMLSTTL